MSRPLLPPLTCRRCGSVYTWPPSRRTGERQHYCSRACYDASRDELDQLRFWGHVEITPGCWLWTAGRDSAGYGVFSLRGHPTAAHRHAWALSHGSVPRFAQVLHTCDTPACVRPDHLYLGEHSDNMADVRARGRRRGERNPAARLTEVQVAALRDRYRTGTVLQRDLAAEYGVREETIHRIITGQTWPDATYLPPRITRHVRN